MRAFSLLVLLIAGLNLQAKNIYISNSGNDANAGNSPAAAWKTIGKLNSYKGLSSGDSVLFNRGDVFYGTINLSANGAPAQAVTYGAYGTGAKPVITGFTKVASWVNTGGSIWESSNVLPVVSAPNIVVKGSNVAPMGRYPNTGWNTIASSTSTSITDALLATASWTGAEVVARKNRWTVDRNVITSQSGGTIRFAAKGSPPQNGWGYFIQNDVKTLDQPNEWYYNLSTHKIKIYSIDTPKNVSVPTIDTLVAIAYKNSLTFENIDFQGANKDALFIQTVNNLTVKNCSFEFCGNAAIDGLWGGSTSNVLIIKNNSFNNNINNGIYLLSQQFVSAYVGYNTFTNTALVPGIGTISARQSVVVYLEGPNSMIEYNRIDSAGYNGIDFFGNNTVVQKNYITNFCLQEDDGGAIYTGIGNGNPVYTGERVLNNIVLNGPGNSSGTPPATPSMGLGNGIYLDDYTANVEVSGNTTANCSNGGIFLHNASFNNVHDNVAFNNSGGQLVMQADGANTINNNTFVKNDLVAKTAVQPTGSFVGYNINLFGTFNSNYYARPVNDGSTIQTNNWSAFTHITLAQWKASYGKDANSSQSPKTVADPGFIRFEYNAAASSKTVNLGAAYIDITGVSHNNSITLQPYTSAVLIPVDCTVPLPKPVVVLSAQ